MNKSELIENVASKCSITLTKAEQVVDLVFATIGEALKQEQRIEIRGFGAFSIKSYGKYLGRNPKTGEKIQVGAKKLPVWRTGLELKKRVDALPKKIASEY